MYAIIEVGARQYSVKKDDLIEVARQEGEKGKDVTFDKVLLLSDKEVEIGTPYVAGARVTASVVKHDKGPKIFSYKYRRRKSSDWQKGHRQELSLVKIKEIKAA